MVVTPVQGYLTIGKQRSRLVRERASCCLLSARNELGHRPSEVCIRDAVPPGGSRPRCPSIWDSVQRRSIWDSVPAPAPSGRHGTVLRTAVRITLPRGVPVWRPATTGPPMTTVRLLWPTWRLTMKPPAWASARSSTRSGRRDGTCDGSCDGWDQFWPPLGHTGGCVPVLVPGLVPVLLRRGALSQVLSGKKRRVPVLVPVLVPVVVPVRLRMTTGTPRRGASQPGRQEGAGDGFSH